MTESARSDDAVLEWGELLVLAGVFGALVGVPLAVDPGGYNPHSPAKAAALMISVSLILGGFLLQPTLLRDTLARFRGSRSIWALALMAPLALASWAFSIDPSQSFAGSYPDYQGLASFAAYAIVASGAVSLLARQVARDVLLRSIVGVLLAIGVLVALSRTGLDPLSLGETTVRRPFATLGSASTLGTYIVVCLPLAVERILEDRVLAWRIVAAVSLVAGAAALLWTSSRGAWVGAVAAIITWMVLWSRGRSRQVRLRLLAGAAGGLLIAVAATSLLLPSTAERVLSTFDTSSPTVAWRLSVWDSTVDLSLERPVLGWGPNSFRFAYPPVRSLETNLESIAGYFVTDPHNLGLSVLVSLGWPAAIVFAAGIVLALGSSWRASDREQERVFSVATASALVGGLAALQFHLLTFSTGALLAVLLASCATQGVAPAPAPKRDHPSGAGSLMWRVPLAAVLAASLGASVLAVGLVMADRAARDMFDLATWGAPWSQVSEPAEIGRSTVPWEPLFDQMYTRAALWCAAVNADPASLDDGLAAARRAAARLPLEASVVSDGAGLLLAVAERDSDSAVAREALSSYERAREMDPSDADHWLGIGRCLDFLGESGPAIDSFEGAVLRAPYSPVAWDYLADAYAAADLSTEASRARAHDLGVLDQ